MLGDEDEDEDEGEGEGEGKALFEEVWLLPEFFRSFLEKKAKDNTPAKAVRAIKTMATAPSRLFIFCLTT